MGRKSKFIVLLIMICVICLATGCKEEVVYDEKNFYKINVYANEIIAAVAETRFDFDLWVEDLTNPEKDWLIMDVAKSGVSIRIVSPPIFLLMKKLKHGLFQ